MAEYVKRIGLTALELELVSKYRETEYNVNDDRKAVSQMLEKFHKQKEALIRLDKKNNDLQHRLEYCISLIQELIELRERSDERWEQAQAIVQEDQWPECFQED